MATYDPTKIRVKGKDNNWVLVLAEPRQRVVRGIILPGKETGVEKVTEGAGVVVGIGDGKKVVQLLKKDDRIVYRGFLKYANPIETDEHWLDPKFDSEKKTYFLMSVDDVMAVIDANLEIGIFSGSPQVPHAT